MPYLTRLVEALAAVDQENEYILLTRPSNRGYFPIDRPNFSDVVFPEALGDPRIRILFEQLIVPVVLLRKNVDVCHFTATVGSLLAPCKSVISIQMVADSFLQRSLTWSKRLYYGVLGRLTARRATRLIVLSDCSKRELLNWCAADPNRVTTVYPGADDLFGPQRAADSPHPALAAASGREFILSVVTDTAAHENLPTLLSAFVRFRRRSVYPFRLVMVGSVQERYVRQCLIGQEGERAAEELFDDIVCTGFLPYTELPPVYARASLFVQISLRECFPFTTIEAMISGVPVIVSNSTAFPEVVADAGILVDPSDPDAVAEQMLRITTDNALRRHLGAQGLRRARTFSWESAARQTVQLYKQAAGELGAAAVERTAAL